MKVTKAYATNFGFRIYCIYLLGGTEKGKGKATQMYSLYIAANSLVKAGSNNAAIDDDAQDDEDEELKTITKDSVRFSKKELYGVQEIWQRGQDIFRLLVSSLCPPIFGHEMVKGMSWITGIWKDSWTELTLFYSGIIIDAIGRAEAWGRGVHGRHYTI